MVEEDSDIFFNQDEFGETHQIDGKSIICIITDESENIHSEYEVIHIEKIKITIPSQEYKKLIIKNPEDRITIDDIDYTVQSAPISIGTVTILAKRNGS